MRLECTACKTKAQLALKRCKHFELGYVLPKAPRSIPSMCPDSATSCMLILSLKWMEADNTTVVTRRPRVLRWYSRCSAATAFAMTPFLHVGMGMDMDGRTCGFCVDTMVELDEAGDFPHRSDTCILFYATDRA